MRKPFALTFIALLFVLASTSQAVGQQQPCQTSVAYGQNADAGRSAKVNGISMYYEIYGSGSPLLLIHGNGGSIASMRCQIEYFSRSHRVIAADSRSHGKTQDETARLTYELMADDLAALLDELKIEKADIIGQSDGGILALLIAIRHPSLVKALVASGPNLRPDAVVPWVIPITQNELNEAKTMLARGDRSKDWARVKRQNELMMTEPHIAVSQLQRIKAPTLILGGDDDLIKLEHLIEIYRNIPQAQLGIFPGATHFIPQGEHELYNSTAERFLTHPFTRPTSKQALEALSKQ